MTNRYFVCRHFSEFLRSHHFCKYQIEVLTSGTVYLADILFCESALFYFSEVSIGVVICFLDSILSRGKYIKYKKIHITKHLKYNQRDEVYLFFLGLNAIG